MLKQNLLRKLKVVSAGLMFAGALTLNAMAASVVSTYTGPVSNNLWSNPLNWTPTGVPNNSALTYDAIVNDIVVADGFFNIDAINNSGNVLLFANDHLGLGVNSTNTGRIVLGDEQTTTSNTATLRINDSLAINGSGSIDFTTANQNRIIPSAASNVLTIGNGQKIQALPGTFGVVDLSVVIEGSSSIISDNANLVFEDYNSTNRGLISANNAGLLLIEDMTLENSNGEISALNGSTITISRAEIQSGVLNGDGSSMYQIDGTSTFNSLGNPMPINNTMVVINENDSLQLMGNVENNATIKIQDTQATSSNLARLRTVGDSTLSGTGTVLFDTENQNYIDSAAASDVLTVGPNQLITTSENGSGRIRTAMTNNGTIDANNGFILLETNAKTNNNTMQASNGGTLQISGITINNNSGQITAGAGSTVDLVNATIQGGMINGNGTVLINGAVHMDSSGGLVNLSATTVINENDRLDITGGLVNNTDIHIVDTSATSANNASLRIIGDQTISGNGTINFGSEFLTNLISSASASDTLTLGSGQTIRTDADGRGIVSTALINEGVVRADGGRIILNTNVKTNNNFFRAANAGVLEINGITVNNQNGTIAPEDTSYLDITNSTIVGGQITGDGYVEINGTSQFHSSGTPMALGVDYIHVQENEELRLMGEFENHTDIQFNDTSTTTANAARLRIIGDVNLTGNGVITFASANQNEITSTTLGDDILTLGAGQTIRTTTRINPEDPGMNGTIYSRIMNNGLIDANNGTITFTSQEKVNTNRIQARDGGTLNFNSITVDNNGGTGVIDIDGSSVLNSSNATIKSGTIQGGGTVQITGSTLTLDSTESIINANNINFQVGFNNALQLNGDLNNNSTIQLDDVSSSTANSATLRIQSDVNLNGTGEIVFNSIYHNYITSSSLADQTLTLGMNQTVRTTEDSVGAIYSNTVNNGLIDADAGIINLLSQDKTNNSTIQARNEGSLIITSVGVNNHSGVIDIEADSVLELSNATIRGGMIQGAGDIHLTGTNTFDSTVSPVTLDGPVLHIANNRTLQLEGDFTNHSDILIEDPSSFTGDFAFLRIDGDVALNGSGNVFFNSIYQNSITSVSLATDVLTVTENQTIQTTPGSIGSISSNTVNEGLIHAAGGGKIFLNSQSKTNNAVIRASGDSEIELTSITVDNTNGQINIQDTSTLLMSNSTITGGLIDGGGDLVFTGTNALDGSASPVTLNDTVAHIMENQTLQLRGTINNNSEIHVEDPSSFTGNFATLRIDGNVSLNGTGSILFNSIYQNTLTSTSLAADVLTIGENQTIEATPGNNGTISSRFVNQGEVHANGGLLILNSQGKENNNLLKATNNGTLNVSSAAIDNNDGDIEIEAGSQLLLTNGTIIGGTIKGGDINVSGSSTLDGEGILLQNLSANIDFNQTLNLVGNITLDNSVINIADSASSTGNFAILRINGDVTINGTGTVQFNSIYQNNINLISGTDTLTLSDDITFIAEAGNNGTISANLVNHGLMEIHGNVAFNGGRSRVNAEDGHLTGSGQLTTDGTGFDNRGLLTPGGFNPGSLTVTGPFRNVDTGLLMIDIDVDDIDGETVTHDVMNVSGLFTAGGTLQFNKDIDFDPVFGEVVSFIDGGPNTGAFSEILNIEIPSGLAMAVFYDDNAISFTPTLFGDATLNGRVDLEDLAKLATNFGSSGAAIWQNGDFTGDGNVDLADLAKLATFFGQDVSGGVAVAATGFQNSAIPEPTSFGLLGMVLGMLGIRRRNRQA